MLTYEELLKQGNATVDEQKKKKTENATQKKEQIGTALDAAADAAASPYRQEIENAPLDSRAAYDQNAMREAIDRKQIRESLANMGMADSGLSSSMQTALAVQKSRADNQVRVEERQRIQAAQSAIDKIYSDMELEKTSQNMAIDQEIADWESNARLSVQTTAQTNAATYYEANQKAATETTKMALEQQKNRNDMAQKFLLEGIPAAEAWGMAYKAYPDYSSDEGIRYAYYAKLRSDGYGVAVANDMSKAYVNAARSGASEAKIAEAVNAAMLTGAQRELQQAGVDLSYNDLFDAPFEEAPIYAKSVYADMIKTVSAPAANYAAAVLTGNRLRRGMATVAPGDVQEYGALIESIFSGDYLDVALTAAGLSWDDSDAVG